MWQETDLSDVSLVSEDGIQIPVHKIILTSCSLFFRGLLSRNPHPLPLICLTGIKTLTLRLVLEYIYLGSCKVAKGELLPFLTAGRDLLVEGLIEPTVIGKQIESKENIIIGSEENHADHISEASPRVSKNGEFVEVVSEVVDDSEEVTAHKLEDKFVSENLKRSGKKEFK